MATTRKPSPDIDTDAPEAPVPAAPDDAQPSLPPGSVVLTPEGLGELTATITAQVLAAVNANATPAAPPLQGPPPPTPEAIAAAHERDQLIVELISDRTHAEGCPVLKGDGGRVEAFGARRPANREQAEPAKDLTVLHCIECGGTMTLEGKPPTHGLDVA